MIAQDVLEGKWHTIRGKLKSKWAKLTEDDLLGVDGGIEQLIGRIQRRTGESQEVIEHFIDQAAGAADRVSHTVHDSLDRAHQAVHHSLDDANDAAQEALHHVAQGVRGRYQQAEQAIHSRPAQSMMVAFGLGVVSGLGVALLLTSHHRQQPTGWGSLGRRREHLGRQLSDAIVSALPESLGGRR